MAELPFGKGKALLGNAHGLVDKLAGGWQIAGTGQWMTNYMALPATSTESIPMVPRSRCTATNTRFRTAAAAPAIRVTSTGTDIFRLTRLTATMRTETRTVWKACRTTTNRPGAPLIPWGSTALPANAPANTNLRSFWDTNTVWVPLSNGTVQRTTYNNNLHPWRNQYINGPHQWFLDASLFKFVPINERVRLRFSVDFFNVLNNPNNPNLATATTDGILATRNSGSPARVTQLSLRLNW